MTILFLALLQGFIFGLAGVAVRVQYALFRGFDFMVGGLVLLSAEAFVLTAGCFPEAPGLGVPAAWLAALLAAVLGAGAWNAAVLVLWRGHWRLGPALFVASLGMNTALTGLIGLVRGPGLAQTPWQFDGVAGLALPTLLGLLVCGCALAALLAARYTRAGLAIELYGQNPQFAIELGVDSVRIATAASVKTGLACGAVGGYLALADGSRPDLGLLLFLYGSAAALLFSAPTLARAVLGGLICGVVFVVSQLVVSPSTAGLFLFAGVAVLLLARGSSRASEGVR